MIDLLLLFQERVSRQLCDGRLWNGESLRLFASSCSGLTNGCAKFSIDFFALTSTNNFELINLTHQMNWIRWEATCHSTEKISRCQWRIQDFPEEGAPTLQRGAPTYDFAKFPQKLHEIERIWPPGGGGARPKFYYVDPPLAVVPNSKGNCWHFIVSLFRVPSYECT